MSGYFPTGINVNGIDSNLINAVSNFAATNDYWQNTKNSRDLYKTQVGKFLVGGQKSNLMVGKNKIVNGMDDPSFLAFSFGITNVDQAGLFGDDITINHSNNMLIPLNKDRSYSALTYLKNAKGNPDGGSDGNRQIFPKEYTELKRFVDGFKEITNIHPYMFQTIEGLTDAYKLYINMHKDSMLGGGKETKIKITCLETMDLRMAALFDSYLQSVYNHQYRRMNIPNNLLRFDCWVLLHDLRNVAQDITELLGPIRTVTPQITKGIINHLSTVIFQFKNCTFNVEEIGSTFDTISNKDTNETRFTFTFNYGDIDVSVNSLADAFEDNRINDEPDNIYNVATDIVTLNNDAHLKRSPTTKFDDDSGYGLNLNIGGLLKKIGSTIFNYATSGNAMGNVYDESWAGILSNMMSTISNASTSSILNSVFQTGRQHAMNALSNKINGSQEYVVGDIGAGLGDNNYNRGAGRGNRPGSQSQQGGASSQPPQLGSIDMEEPVVSDHFVSDNVYVNIPPSEALTSWNVYGSIPPYQAPQMNEHIDMHTFPSTQPSGSINISAPSPNSLNIINVYQITQQNNNFQSGNVYGNVPPHHTYHGEMADMTSYTQNGILVAETIDMTIPNPSVMEGGSVYNEVRGKSKAQFHINVYDRIIESITNPMPIEKIFDTPRQPKKMQKENVFPLIRVSKKDTGGTENVYPKAKEGKTNFSNDNIYGK